jgi:DNA helicase-2/ATP-dependent DNA helicase PcrA
MIRPVVDLPGAEVVARLGRGVIVGPGAPAPEPWSAAERVAVDDSVLADPASVIETLHRHWSQRIPVVVELQCAADELRAPEIEGARAPFELSPRFEFGRERLYFLTRANNYDDRVGRMVWGPAVEAQRLGAVPAAGSDVVLADGTPAWCDGGPRTGAPSVPDDHVLVHRNNLEQRVLTPDRSVTSSAELAADQLAAVVHDAGAARVIAPAGSGKTRVLTERFRLLVDRGWSPGSITAVAYNVRAKDTMRDRLADMPERARRRVRTLHALGNDVLGRGGGDTALIDEWEMRRRIEALVPVKPRANTDMYAPYLEALSEVRLGLVDPNAVEARRDDVAGFGAMFEEYRDKLHADRVIDHDEQIYGAIEVLLRMPDVRGAFQREARHLLVDEFQDLTPAQLLLLRLVAAPAYDVFGVGDDDQVIYGYAGADPEFLINYDRYFPGGTHHALATNYRCPEPVVTATRNLLSYNRRRIDKEIVAAKSAGDSDARTDAQTNALSIVSADPERVAGAAVERVTAWLEAGAQPHEIAVLSRVNSVLLPAQLLLGEAGVPSWTPVSVAVLNRTGTRSALAYLRLALAAGNNTGFHGADLALAARRPSRSLRREVLQRLERKRAWTMGQLRREPDALTGTAAAKFDAFCDDLEALGQAFDGGATTARLLTLIRDDVGLGAALATLDLSGKAPDASHRDDLNALISVATFEPAPASFEPWLRDRLRAPNERAGTDGVALSTVHRVKGMEWPYVVVFGAHDGLMPHALADDVEEERRIFHVAITRGDTAVQVIADATARRPFLDELLEPAPVRPERGRTAAAVVQAPPNRAKNTIDAELGLDVEFAGSSGSLVELRVDGAVLEEPSGTRVVIPYGERVELDGRRAQLVRGRSAEVTHASPALVEALKAWRKQRAASDRVPAYIVLSDAHLEGIADRRPESLADLANCTGIGPTKLERYGDEIIAVIADSPAD